MNKDTNVEQMAIKCLIHAESGRLLGSIAKGSHVAEIVNLVSAAMATGQSGRAIADLSAVHPSATEALVRTLQRHFERQRSSDRPTEQRNDEI